MDDSEPVDIERRDLRPDRRQQPTPMLSRHSFFGGRRRGERRGALSTEGLYVDRYPAWLFMLLLSLCALNLIDATYTLLQIANGAVELNPVAAALLDLGPRTFILTKVIGVGLVLCFLCVHTNFKRGRMVLIFGVAAYFLVAVYHIITYAMVT